MEASKNSVLIIDDSKQNIDALRSILEGDYKVYVALSGESGLTTMKRTNPDIVLLDVVMPGLDGFGVLERMRENQSLIKIPVIFITGEGGAINESRGLKLGAFDYITKPYNPDIICIKIKNQLDNKNYRDNLENIVAQQTKELIASREAIIMGMSLLAEGRDKGTGAHIKRIKKYTELLAWQIQALYPEMLPETELQNIVLFSPLHDIGKVCIPDAILLKPGKLTPEEFDIIKSHTTFGADVLRKTETFMQEDIDTLRIAVEIAESHHEKFDGTGYPLGKKGKEIPLPARIVALADVYDALASKREYKPALPHEAVCDIILKGDGRTEPSHFDPVVLQAFTQVSDAFRDLQISE